MSSCDESNIKKNYIVQSAADFDVLSACTAFYTNNIYNCTGGTLTLHSDIVSANTINASVYLSGGTNLLDILVSLDNFTTGATLIGSTAYFDRTNSLSAYTLDLSSLDISDTYITAFTYDNANTFTISDNSGTTFNATINIVTGLTVNGGLSATTVSACTGIYTSNLYGCSPITIHDSVQSITSSATGTTSFAFGEDNNAHGHFSFAINRLNTSSGLASFASGRGSIASGSYSHSIGVGTKATATASYAEGSNTVASGSSAHAEGESTIAGSNRAHAEGNLTIAIGESSHSEGEGTTASGIASHAEGYYNLAIGNASHAEGGHDGSPMSNPTSATTHSAHAEGMGTLASGIASHAEGKATIAGGDYSHAEGWGTNAGGDYSHAGGRDSSVVGDTSFIHSSGSTLSAHRSAILGGRGITGSDDDTVYVPHLNINLIDNDDSLTQILSRNGSGTIKYRDVSSIIGAASADTYVISGNANASNSTLTFTNNSGSTFTVTNSAALFSDNDINVTGGTYNPSDGCVTFATNSGTTFEVCGFLTGFTDNDNYVTGGTLNSGTLTLNRQNGLVTITGFTTDLDTYVTGGTISVSANNSDNNGTIGLLYKNSDGIPRTLPFEDTFTTGGTYDNSTALITFKTNSGSTYTVDLSTIDVNDTFVTGGTYNPATVNLDFSGNTGFSPFSVDVSSLKDDTNTYVTGNTYTSATDSTNQSILNLLYQGTTVGGPYSLSSEDTYITGTTFGSNQAVLTRNDGTEIFKLSGSSTVQLTNPSSNKIFIDVTIPPGLNTYVTGFTYNNANTFTISDSSGSTFDSSINIMTGLTINGDLTVDGDNLSPSLYTTAKVTANSGTSTTVYSLPVSTYTGAWFEYTVKGTTSLRAGNIASIFSGTSVNHNETTTTDIGDTSDLLLDVIISGPNALLTASATTSNWEIKTIIRSI